MYKTLIAEIGRLIKGALPFAIVNGAGGFFSHVSLQGAINSGAYAIWVRSGTYSGAFTIPSTANVRLIIGCGEATILDGGTTGHALVQSKAGCVLAFFSAQTTTIGGNPYDAFQFNARSYGIGLNVISSDRWAYQFTDAGDNSILAFSRSQQSDQEGIYVNSTGHYVVIVANSIRGWASAWISENSGTAIAPTTANVTTA